MEVCQQYELVTMLFSDIVTFTVICSRLKPLQVRLKVAWSVPVQHVLQYLVVPSSQATQCRVDPARVMQQNISVAWQDDSGTRISKNKVLQVTLQAKFPIPDLQRFPWNFNLKKNREENVFITRIVLLVFLKPQNEINSLNKQKCLFTEGHLKLSLISLPLRTQQLISRLDL